MRTPAILFLALISSVDAFAVLTVGGTIIQPHCGVANGSIMGYATGGTPPYSYLWAPAPPGGQGTSQASGLLPGTYTLTVTDQLGDEDVAFFTLVDQPFLPYVLGSVTWVYNGSAAHHPCPGYTNGSIAVITSALDGVPPYTVTVNGQPPLGYDLTTNEPYFGYFSTTDQISVHVEDVNGCSGDAQVISDSPTSLGFTTANIDPACAGMANGSVDLYTEVAGPYGPSIIIWDPLGNAVYDDQPYDSPLSLTGLGPGMHNVYGAYSPTYFPEPGCDFGGTFTIPDLGPDCGTVNGRVFIDNDQDCVQDSGEPSIPFRVIEIMPGPEYAITNNVGDYTRNLVNGNFTLDVQGTGTDLYPLCPPANPTPFTVDYDVVTLNIADSSLVALDVNVWASAGIARPGFVHSVWGTYSNEGGQLSGPVALTATFDPQMAFLSATPAPTNVVGNTVSWDLPPMTAFGSQNFALQLQVPADVGLLGLPFSHSFTVSQPLPEPDLAGNSTTTGGTFQGAFDPNDKRVLTSSLWSDDLYYIGQDEWLDYAIRFQNTGTDTAFTVVVTDTLDTTLDMASFTQGPASHPFTVSFLPGRVVEWRFADILLPDSTTNEAASHGLVAFRIKPQEPVLPGTVLSNAADIFFDFNPPVRTNDAVLVAESPTGVAEAATPQMRAVPNPAREHLTLLPAPEGAWAYRILAADGRVMGQGRSDGGPPSIAVHGLAMGTYILEVRTPGGTVERATFLKQ